MAEQIEFGSARFIRLGPRHAWAGTAIGEGTLHLGYGKASHDLALAGDAEGLKEQLLSLGRSAQKAAQEARQVIDFYKLGADCLWITLYEEHLWWAFAAPEVTWHGQRENGGDRTRKTIGGWRHTDTEGRPLWLSELSSRLTDVGRYRKSLCDVRERGYLARVINGGVRWPLEDTDEARARHAAFMDRCDNPNGFEILSSVESRRLLPKSASTTPIAFDTARYIKIGSSGEWNDAALQGESCTSGAAGSRTQLGETCDAGLIRQHLIPQGKKPGVAAGTARQVVDFYSLGRYQANAMRRTPDKAETIQATSSAGRQRD